MHKPSEHQYNQWNQVKKQLSSTTTKNLVGFKKRQVWWCSLGINIGQEVYGKGQSFSRPVLIIKRLSAELCIVIPLTTKKNMGDWYYEFQLKGKSQFVMLHQLRVLHINRFKVHISKISNIDFIQIQKKLKQLLEL